MKLLFAILMMASTLGPTPEQDKRIKKLEDTLMAPCCYSQTIRLHMSAEAEQMREEVTSMVMAGRSEQEVIRYYKAKYGETILVVPDGTAGTITYAVPVLAFLLGSSLLTFLLKRSIDRKPVRTQSPAVHDSNAISADLLLRIRKETDNA